MAQAATSSQVSNSSKEFDSLKSSSQYIHLGVHFLLSSGRVLDSTDSCLPEKRTRLGSQQVRSCYSQHPSLDTGTSLTGHPRHCRAFTVPEAYRLPCITAVSKPKQTPTESLIHPHADTPQDPTLSSPRFPWQSRPSFPCPQPPLFPTHTDLSLRRCRRPQQPTPAMALNERNTSSLAPVMPHLQKKL